MARQTWGGGCSGALVLLTLLARPGFQWNPQHHQLPISKCWIYTLQQEQRANPWANKTWRKRAVFKLGIRLSNIYILDIANIQIAGWASLNLVWKQAPSAVCLLAWVFLICFWPLLPSYLWLHTQQQRHWRYFPTLSTHLSACFAFSTYLTNSCHPWAFIAWLFIQLPSLNSSGRPMSDIRISTNSEKPSW